MAVAEVRKPYYAYSVFLDNAASGYTVSGNVLREPERAAVRVHHGRENAIVNNHLQHDEHRALVERRRRSRSAVKTSSTYNTTANAFSHNVVYLWNATTAGAIYSARDEWRDDAYLEPVDHNLYADPFVRLATLTDGALEPLGDWRNWTTHADRRRLRRAPTIDVEPGFRRHRRRDHRICVNARAWCGAARLEVDIAAGEKWSRVQPGNPNDSTGRRG